MFLDVDEKAESSRGVGGHCYIAISQYGQGNKRGLGSL